MSSQNTTWPAPAVHEFDRLSGGDPTLARPSDPGTSHEAANGISAEAKEASELAVVIALQSYGPLTDEQVLNKVSGRWTPQRLRTARAQLVDKGVVRELDRDGRNVSGVRAIRWVLA